MAAKPGNSLPKNLLSSPFLGELLAKRSVYVKVRPAPQSLTHRRAILRVLRQHGRIEVFKSLGEPHSFISVASDSATARNLILKAPLEVAFASAPSPPPSGTQTEEEQQGEKFLVDIFEAGGYNHKRFASHLSPLAGPWKNITAYPGDLATTVTVPGLTDGDGDKREVHEDEGLLKSFARRHLEGGYKGDNGWRGMTDWEGGGQDGGEYREDGETFEGGWRGRVMRGRWRGRGYGGLVRGEVSEEGEEGGRKEEGERKEKGKEMEKVKVRRIVSGGGGEVLPQKGEVARQEKVEEGRRWTVKERSGLVGGVKRWV
ncbi:uncharacterized protein QC763_201323 [Podospora pseudopauciseta]|uniref:Uncharacterized protein n=1 Tax=Podospora pseudopauciseta TaxID=2093780 RepID=A0ABR0HMU1_9PEZI|nr:hypothetical protein QC763_201323 [Podospora pseudopauciseta]